MAVQFLTRAGDGRDAKASGLDELFGATQHRDRSDHVDHVRTRRPGLVRASSMTALMLVMVALCVTVAVLWLSGWRAFFVQSGSMGTAAPVGSLVVTRPTPLTQLRPGEVIAFHPPGVARVYTHRIVAVHGGQVTTKGDANDVPDAWRLDNSELIGRAVIVAPGVGWLLRAVPALLLGWCALWWLTRRLAQRRRVPVRVLGSSIVISVVSWRLHPWVNAAMVSVRPVSGSTQVRLQSIGLLPIRVTAIEAHAAPGAVDIARDGETATMRLWGERHPHVFALDAQLQLSILGWVVAIAVCLVPLLWFVILGVRDDDREDPVE